MNTTNTTAKCPTCNGSGTIRAFMHIANGRCFACAGSGVVSVAPASKGNSRPTIFTRATAIETLAGLVRGVRAYGLNDNEGVDCADQIRRIAANITCPRDVAERALAVLAAV